MVMAPENNIYVRPNDSIYIYREQQKFIALGATSAAPPISAAWAKSSGFDAAWRINLSEAVGKAGGLVDSLADPGAVFSIAPEPREVAAELGVDVSKYTTETIPIIFHVNFRDPGGFFLATKVMMKNQDIIYLSNSRNVEVTKFLAYLRVIIGTANDMVALGNNGRSSATKSGTRRNRRRQTDKATMAPRLCLGAIFSFSDGFAHPLGDFMHRRHPWPCRARVVGALVVVLA